MPTCEIQQPNQFASAIPGNIGIVRAKVEIWDHDPFCARPMQNLSFPFNDQVGKEVRDEGDAPNTHWILNTLMLESRYNPKDMFIATTKPSNIADTGDLKLADFDFVGSEASGAQSNVTELLPGGFRHNPNEFEHQLWIHVGSIFRNFPILHPSEYTLPLSEVGVVKNPPPVAEGFEVELSDLQNAPKWDYHEDKEGEKFTFWPYMISKQAPNAKHPVHWTIEKFREVWQGADFIITVKRGDKSLDLGIDTIPEDEVISSLWQKYQYLMYTPRDLPFPLFFQHGFSNEAYSLRRSGSESFKEIEDLELRERQLFWWAYKSYILVEIGVEDSEHNYIIELVKGRQPRFVHLGEEFDHPDRLTGNNKTIYDSTEGWDLFFKSRVLSIYQGASVDALLSQEELRISVQNHLGKIIIIFQGHEDNPWVVSRQDRDASTNGRTKTRKTVIVANKKIRIHGGNISAKLNFSLTQYPASASVTFPDLMPDTNEATDKNVYMTFSHMGDVSNKSRNNILKKFFKNDPRLGKAQLTYDCDASRVVEVIQNKNGPVVDSVEGINLYEEFRQQYEELGKGWLTEFDTVTRTNVKVSTGITRPHQITLKNSTGGNQADFDFSLQGKQHDTNPHKDFAAQWDVRVDLDAGDVEMSNSGIFSDAKKFLFPSVLTPIATQWRSIVTCGEKAVEDKIDKIDISPLVVDMTDKWNSDEYTTLTHEMTLRCHLPIGTAVGLPPQAANEIDELPNLNAIAKKLHKLHKQAFYVTVKYWWDKGIGLRQSPSNELSGSVANLENDDTLIQMTGIAYGGEFEWSNNRLFMNIKVTDYMSAMQKQFIFNSPFFDGVADTLAIYELAKLAGFDDITADEKYKDKPAPRIDRRPLGYLQAVLNDLASEEYIYNGEESVTRVYDLPATYANLANPAVRFQNGESFESALKKLSQWSGKTIYFDRLGVLKYENTPAYEAAFASAEEIEDKFTPVYEFISSPRLNLEATAGSGGGSSLTDGFTFDPTRDAARLVYNVIRFQRSVEDCVNQIVLMTASRDLFKTGDVDTAVGGFIIEGHTFFDQIWKPDSEGFLGFRKAFYQSNGIFGGIPEVRKALQHYAKMKFPPTVASFETYGVPGLKALDVVTLDKELFYITEISHDIKPEDNKWWMTISGEWFKPFRDEFGVFDQEDPEQETA